MKNFILILFVFVSLQLTAQTDGISYQAVIIGPDNQELPGVDAEGNILPDATVAIRFTILDESNQVEYQEVQTTNTDQYGRINLIIGEMDPDGFAEISWDGTNKDLKVEIDFEGGTSYVDMAREKLTFLPYAFHRNITASGTLTVDDLTFLNGELQVEGPANLNSTLNVNGGNATNLSGDLTVEGNTNLNNDLLIIGDLEVVGATVLNDSLNVVGQATTNLSGNVNIGGNLNVEGNSDFDALTGNTLLINNETTLAGLTTIAAKTNINDQLIINWDSDAGLQSNPDFYPLKVEGSSQGIAIKVDGSRSAANNFIAFWDDDQMWGRIEGQNEDDLPSDWAYDYEKTANILEKVDAGIEAATKLLTSIFSTAEVGFALTSSTACAGLGACITVPIPSFIASKFIKTVIKILEGIQKGIKVLGIINKGVNFLQAKEDNLGITFASGAGDYAEWLPKENNSEVFNPGELVGIKNGLVSKSIYGSDKVMIVSTKPIILGNMPLPFNEENSVKVAFMGQVPVKIIGPVSSGDYIIPNLINSSFGLAVSPSKMKTRDYKNVVGVAWDVIKEISDEIKLVNVAVGINTNDLTDVVYRLEEELIALKEITNQVQNHIIKSNEILAKLVPEYAESMGDFTPSDLSSYEVNPKNKNKSDHGNIENSLVYNDEDDLVYFKATRAQIETGIEMARMQYQQMLDNKGSISELMINDNLDSKAVEDMENLIYIPIEDHPFWKKVDNDPAYKEELIHFIQSNIEKSFHSHKKYLNNFSELEIRKD